MITLDSVVFQLTRECDEACAHCFFDASPSKTEQLSLKQACDGVEDLVKTDIIPSEFILTGGEPTLWSGLQQFIALLRSTYPASKIRIDTNGLHLFSNPSLFDAFNVDSYHLSVDTFHNEGIVQKANVPADVFISGDGTSKLVDFFLQQQASHRFGLYVRWTSKGEDEDLFQRFRRTYEPRGVIIERKAATATGRGRLLPLRMKSPDYLIHEHPENFTCLMGRSLILAINGSWHGCYHPVSLTYLVEAGDPDLGQRFAALRQSTIYSLLPRAGISAVFDAIQGKSRVR